MNSEKPSFQDILKHKRAAASVLLGITTVSLLASCSLENSAPALSPSPSRSHEQGQTPHFDKSTETGLLKFYESEVDAAPEMMHFITMPENDNEAATQAKELAATIKDWSDNKEKPVIIMEPTRVSGDNLMNLDEMAAGKYDEVFDTYFSTLKEEGVTSAEIGALVPLPEPNLPQWKNGITNPQTFDRNFTMISSTFKKYFPDAPVWMMLDSTSHPDNDWGTSSTATSDLLKYTDIKPGLVDSFGLQGFPWKKTDAPADFLNGEAAAACANKLGIKRVWFNTGTWSETHNPDSDNHPLTMNDKDRASILAGIFRQAKAAQSAGLQIDAINLFAQNNFDNKDDGSAVFSYTTPNDLSTLRTFVNHAKSADMPVMIFDDQSNQ